ncbi:MAG: hypothetical protein M0P41_07140 [Sphaerochaeta sp.]|nr:hypothetical protein [Sphaerochaeta sp.]
MKKNHILTSITLTLLLSFMLLSCNADATAGLFRQISESKAPVGIVYKQIVGIDSSSSQKALYFLTDEGLYKSDGTSSSRLVANAEENIISTAYLDTTAAKVVFQTNDGTKKLYSYNLITGALDSAAIADFSTFDFVKLLPNGLVLTKDGSDAFALYKYTDVNAAVVSIGTLPGFGVEAVLQPSGTKHQDLSTTPLLVSLTDGSDYKHYYVSGSGSSSTATALPAATEDIRYASMTVINNSGAIYIYMLTYEGALYGASSVTGPFTLMHTASTKSYEKHAFMYAYSDGATTDLITKPKGINEPLYVISFNDNTVDTTGVSAEPIRDGYGVYLDAVEIVDSYEKSDGTLLIATLNNGMYGIDIGGNTSTNTENYSL